MAFFFQISRHENLPQSKSTNLTTSQVNTVSPDILLLQSSLNINWKFTETNAVFE